MRKMIYKMFPGFKAVLNRMAERNFFGFTVGKCEKVRLMLKKITGKPNMLITAKILCSSAAVMYAVLSVYSGVFYNGCEYALNGDYYGVCGESEEAMVIQRGVYESEDDPDRSAKFDSELRLLAGYITKAGKNKPYLAKLAIGAVVVNRIGTVGFPDTVAEVILGLIESGESGIGSFGEIISEADSSSLSAAYSALRGADPTFGAVLYSEDEDIDIGSGTKTCHIYGIDFYSIKG